jgi:axial budding pattern protein 2
MLITLLYIFGSIITVISTQSLFVANPLDLQLPLIARVDKPYYWSFAECTFSPGGGLNYTTSSLPGWLAFNPHDRSFQGTPTAEDEGSYEITVTADDNTDSTASSHFTLLVSSSSAPTLRLSISEQFHPQNPALSSVFLLSQNSALRSNNPTLRIPPQWSFSIGLEGSMYQAEASLYYAALRADGSPLPEWIDFDERTITFNGVTPSDQDNQAPQMLSLTVHASDQRGYTAGSEPFDIFIAVHELSASPACLPTINITASTPFDLNLTSPADFTGVLIDGNDIQPPNITILEIDVSKFGQWLKYDAGTRSLSGTPPDDLQSGQVLPVLLGTAFNQSLKTNFSLAVVPSFFTTATLPVMPVQDDVYFLLTPYFANATKNDDVKLSAAFDPPEAGSYLSFDPTTGELRGKITSDDLLGITVTWTAYSHVTHSTSHTSLRIDRSSSQHKGHHPHGLSVLARQKLILGLSIAFGIIGGAVFLGVVFAGIRRYMRLQDTALVGKEGTRGWTEDDKKWYGIQDEEIRGENVDRGYGWTEQLEKDPDLGGTKNETTFYPVLSPPTKTQRSYGGLGIGRIFSRTPSGSDVQYLSPRSAAVMRKGSFIERIRQTVRNASDKYTRHMSVRKRPIISKPALISSTRGSTSLPFEGSPEKLPRPAANPFVYADAGSSAASAVTTFTGSPSSSTGVGSIPTRRGDLQTTPRVPATVHFAPTSNVRPTSMHSTLSSNGSVRTHAVEAVVYTASRATSAGSDRATSTQSFPESGAESATGLSAPARIMPFTKSNRVPVPGVVGSNASRENMAPKARVVSQKANVVGVPEGQDEVDELTLGARYVQEFGRDDRDGLGGTRRRR